MIAKDVEVFYAWKDDMEEEQVAHSDMKAWVQLKAHAAAIAEKNREILRLRNKLALHEGRTNYACQCCGGVKEESE